MQRLDAAGHYVSESAAHEPHADRTTFDLYCPAIGREVPESDLSSATVLRGHVERILIVTDYRVPGRLGTDLATQIHAINSTIPFIMLTGNPPR